MLNLEQKVNTEELSLFNKIKRISAYGLMVAVGYFGIGCGDNEGTSNNPPVLDPISNIVANEGDLIKITPTATDPDGDSITFTYSTPLDTNGKWQTDYTDAGNYITTVTASDGKGGTDSQNVNITVNNISGPPILQHINDIVANEADLIKVTPTATDPDGNTLTWDLQNKPSNMTINPSTGEIKWQTTYVDSGNYTVKVIVDDGTGTDSQDVNITVNNISCYRIAFVSNRDGNLEIYVMNEDGSGQTNISKNPSYDDYDPSWSPNGSKIACVSNRGGGVGIYTMNADGTGISGRLTSNLVKHPSWSPDGSYIVYEFNSDIWRMTATGNNQINLTPNAVIDTSPAWYPGTKIVFDAYSGVSGSFDICTINENGGERTDLTSGSAAFDGDPSWSPDGTKIAFYSNRDGNNQIYKMNANGTVQTPLTITSSYHNWYPSWSSHNRIAYTANKDGNYDIYSMDTTGSDIKRLTENPAEDKYPSWSPNKQ